MSEQTDWMALGRRAVACAGWRWMPGMRAHHPPRCKTGHYGVVSWAVRLGKRGGGVGPDCRPVEVDGCCGDEDEDIRPDWTPDLRDPATVGCLLWLVRAVWGDPGAYARPSSRGGWGLYSRTSAAGPMAFGRDEQPRGATEAEALVAALEGAPAAGSSR